MADKIYSCLIISGVSSGDRVSVSTGGTTAVLALQGELLAIPVLFGSSSLVLPSGKVLELKETSSQPLIKANVYLLDLSQGDAAAFIPIPLDYINPHSYPIGGTEFIFFEKKEYKFEEKGTDVFYTISPAINGQRVPGLPSPLGKLGAENVDIYVPDSANTILSLSPRLSSPPCSGPAPLPPSSYGLICLLLLALLLLLFFLLARRYRKRA